MQVLFGVLCNFIVVVAFVDTKCAGTKYAANKQLRVFKRPYGFFSKDIG
jgi:hypothetical protein